MTAGIIFACLCMLFTIVFCIVRAKKATYVSLTLKTLASLCFIMIAVVGMVTNGYSHIRLFILIGLCFGLIGDVVLDLKIMYPSKDSIFFRLGTIAFFIGHLFFMAASIILLSSFEKVWLIVVAVGIGIVLTIAITFASKVMKIDYSKHFILVTGYTFILSTMLALSIIVAIFIPIYWVFAGGMLAFILSDLVLSTQYFGGNDKKIMIYINHILYYIAQILIALMVLIA